MSNLIETKKITQNVFFSELNNRELTPKDFINSIENKYDTILNFKDFTDDFNRKGFLTAPKEALFKMFINKYDEDLKRKKLQKALKETFTLATGIL
jgi:hypothetical protein